MSLAIKSSARSRGQMMRRTSAYRGDPGIFGSIANFVGGAVKTVGGLVGGPIGTVASKLGGAVQKATSSTPAATTTARVPAPQIPASIPIPTFGGGGSVATALAKPQQYGVVQAGMQTPPPGPGYRPNKSGYWREWPKGSGQAVWVPPQSIWVRIRRRNPGNSRANDRAMSRLASAKRMAKQLARVTIRPRSCRA